MNISSEELVKKGNDYINYKNCPDSALVCFTIVTNRYRKDLSKEEKRLCCDAYLGNWFVYFLYYFDYHQSYYNLLKAAAIRDEMKIEYPKIELDLGCLYHTLYEQCKDKSLGIKASYYFKKAFESAYKIKDKHTANIVFSNLLFTAYETGVFESVSEEWERYRLMPMMKKDHIHVYNSILYNILNHINEKEYDKALVLSDSLINSVKDVDYVVRYKYMAQTIKGSIFALQGNYKKAVPCLKIAENMAVEKKITDARLEVYYNLADYYSELNDKPNADKYRTQYYTLKDTLLNYRQVTSISEMSFLNEIDKMDVEIKEIKHKKEIQNVILLLTLIILFIIVIFSVMLFLKNKQMNKSNKNLFVNYQKLVKTEEDAQRKLMEYMNELKLLRNTDVGDKDKYQSSCLQTDDKEELLYKILTVMENIEEICSPTFSSDRLSQLTGTNYRYVSQVINEKYGCNFNSLLNQFRIKEACRRLTDTEKYGCYTTEAISESVGFKSRTTFINSFKKVTGLTPSQYQKIALKEKVQAS